MAYEPQPRFFQRGIDRAEAFFHFATIREQREHASVLRKMRLHKEIFERFQVARLIGLGNIGEHKHLHIFVEIVARSQHAGICPRLLGLAKAHGAEEVLEIVSHGDCRARIHHGMRFLVEGFVERSANIHDKSLEAFGDAFRLA